MVHFSKTLLSTELRCLMVTVEFGTLCLSRMSFGMSCADLQGFCVHLIFRFHPRFVLNHKNEVKAFLNQPVGALGLGQQKVLVVKNTSTVLEALHVIEKNKVSALGVVDSTGQLTQSFSASDLRVGVGLIDFPQ